MLFCYFVLVVFCLLISLLFGLFWYLGVCVLVIVCGFVVMSCFVGWVDLFSWIVFGLEWFLLFLFLIVRCWFVGLVIFDCGILIYGGLL